MLSVKIKKYIWFTLLTLSIASFSTAALQQTAAAACTAPDTSLGTDTLTVHVPSAGTYRVWSRIWAPDTTNNSYNLVVDNGCAIDVGDGSLAATTWSWVDYHDGASGSKVDVALTAGDHSFLLVGREPGVRIDRIILTQDTTCVPTGNGNNCAVIPPVTPPTPPVTPPPGGTQKRGDVTGPNGTPDDKIDVFDLSYLIRNYNTNNLTADVTGPNNSPDNKVDIFDLSYVIRNYGQ